MGALMGGLGGYGVGGGMGAGIAVRGDYSVLVWGTEAAGTAWAITGTGFMPPVTGSGLGFQVRHAGVQTQLLNVPASQLF
jgi:hypothetical protein